MTRTYELPHFSVARVVSHAEYVEGCGGGPTVGVGVGTNCVGVERGGVWVGVADAVGVGVTVVPGAGVAWGVGVPGVVEAVTVPVTLAVAESVGVTIAAA